MKRLVAPLLALWLGLASAQIDAAPGPARDGAGARLPLASVGTVLRWAPQVDELFFDLPDASWVRLAVYSPSIDLDEVGDERYDDRPLEASFLLLAPGGEVLAAETFTLAPSGWQVVFDGPAEAGRHRLRSEVLGNGKNVYLLRLETEFADVALHGAQVTVNVGGRDWQPALGFEIATTQRCELDMYDGDGADELEAVLVLPSGVRVVPTVSGDLAWSVQNLPRLQGLYTVELRLPPQATQATNAVRFELRCGGVAVPLPLVPPATLVAPELGAIAVEVVDLQGRAHDLGHRVDGRFDRIVTLDDDEATTLVGIEAAGGDVVGARSVAFGLEGGSVRFVVDRVARRVPLPEPRVDLAPLLPLPRPTPIVVADLPPLQPLPRPTPSVAVAPAVDPLPEEPPAPAVLELARELVPAALVPCQLADVRLTLRNLGGTAAPYDLREGLPAGIALAGAAPLGDDRTLAWSGVLEPGGVAVHAYRLRMEAGPAEGLTLAATVGGEGDVVVDRTTLLRAPLDLALELVSADRTLYADDVFVVEVRVANPLDRPLTLWLEPTVSSRVVWVDGPTTLELPAAGVGTARFTLAGREAGAAAFQLVAHACDPATAEFATAGAVESVRLTLAPVPELPTPTLSTEIEVDLAVARLPVLDRLVLVSRLPDGARYLAGSSRVDGVPVADPREVDRALLFEFAAGRLAGAGRVAYTLLHDDPIAASDADHALVAWTPHPEVLIGDPAALDLLLADAPVAAPAPVERDRVGVLIVDPVEGAVVRAGATLRVTVDADLGHEIRLFVNDELVPADRVGQVTRDAGLGRQTLQYLGVPLQAGPNLLRVESWLEGALLLDAVAVHLAGSPAAISVVPLSPLVTDTIAPLRFEVLVADAWGVAPRDSFVTIDVGGGAVAGRDADPQRAGHQVAFRDGRGVLELAPFAAPGRFTIVAAVGVATTVAEFEVGAEARPWIVNGIGSLGVHLRDGLRAGASGSLFARGALFGDALLTLAVRAPFEPVGLYGDPYERFPVVGSSGAQSADAQSRHGVYARLERGQNHLQYGDFVADFAGGLQSVRSYTGLSGAWTGASGFGVRAYAAYVPVADVVAGLERPADGTSAVRLPHAPLRPGSLRLEVVKRDRLDGRLLLDDGDPLLRTLQPAADYTVDEGIGLVLLVRPLPLADGAGHPYLLRASYRVADVDDGPAFAQFGVQASYDLGGVTLRAGVSQETRGPGAFERLASTGAAVDLGGLTADLDVGYGQDETSGGLGVALSARYAADGLRAEAEYRFLGVGYRGGGVSDDAQAGHAAKFGVAYALTPEWSLSASAQARSATLSGDLDLDGRLLAAYQGRGDVLVGERLLGTRPRLEVGVQADAAGVRALGSVALRDLLGLAGSEVRATHLQGLGVGVGSVTDLSVAYRISDALELRLTERLLWGQGHALLLGLQSNFEHAELARRACAAGVGRCDPGAALALGRSTLTAQYEVPGGVGATAGSLRLGLDTRYPLTERLRAEGSLAQVLDLDDPDRNATVATVGLLYDGATFDASARYEIRVASEGVKQVATAGATGALGADAFGSVQLRYLDDPAAAVRHGFGVSVAGAYRGDRLTLLAHHRATIGNLQADGATEFEGDTQASWRLSRAWELRAGHAYQLLPGDAFVDLWSLGLTAHPWDGGSVHGSARLFHDWGSGAWSPGVGLEAAQTLGCGFYGVVGVNAWDGIGTDRGAVFGQSGVYLRLDAVFDERWRCGRERGAASEAGPAIDVRGGEGDD